jgi:hypothetical protein
VTKSKTKWPVIAGIAFIVVFIAAMMYSTLGNNQFRCEVCITFNGQTICRNGAGTSREQAERVATDSACTDLGSGMTQLMQCQNNAPRRVAWKQ